MPTGDGILTLAVQKLGDFLLQEANLLLGVKNDVEWVRRELVSMQAFLRDVEQRQGNDERTQQWIVNIRAFASETKDIIDDYYTEVKGKEPSKRKLFTTFLRKCCCIAGETNVYDIGTKIRALKERLSDIKSTRVTYGTGDIGNAQEIANAAYQRRLWELRRTTSCDDEEHFVGFVDDVKLLETHLFLPDKRRSVISISGMGGLGKTTLARKLYHTYKCKFVLHAWVCVSRDWEPKDLLERIIKSLKELTNEELNRLEKMNDEDMKRYLRKLLKDKLYLVVIDDLWDESAWGYLRSALPDYQNGSRVITTTRNASVAGLSDQRTYVHKLGRLRADESWELFCKNAFSKQNGVCPKVLSEIGKKMVEKCDGLPLAIIVLGGLLSRKEPHEWHNIKKRIWKELDEHSIHISALLNLSYDDLSPELKKCFLYLGIFPEDHDVRRQKLVTLWIAEDLISQSEGLDLEEQAERYINELNSRSLIQVIKSKYGSDSTCRVDDVLRDLAVNKAKNLELFHIYEESMNPPIGPSSVERIAFRSGFEKYMASKHSYPRLHTVSFLNCRSLLDDDNVTKLLTLINTTFRSLRVLDLEGVKIVSTESELKLFKAMEKLVNLRYLGLFQTDIDELPESIGKLQALQAVDVLSISGERILLPRNMHKLKKLRHLS